jgi:hypothetical protein
MKPAADQSVPDGADEGSSVDLALVPSAQGILGHDLVQLAVRLVDAMGLLDQVSAWKAEEVKGPGGRPVMFPTRALLVAFVVCALSDKPLHLTRVCEVMFRQLSPAWRQALGIPDPPPEHDRRAWEACYRNVRTRFHDMVDLIDPSPEPKNRRLDHETFEARTAERQAQLTDEEWSERYRRLEYFINQILEASISLVPREVIRNWKGSVGVDATLVKSPARAQKQRRLTRSRRVRPEILVHSADSGAAWYRRDGDHRDDTGEDGGSTGRGKLAWGREATLVISGSESPEGDQEFPNLAVGMAVLHPPGHEVGLNGARALASVRAREHPANFLAADRAYSSAKEEDFQLPAQALGYKAVYDYKIDQLGVKGAHEGFLLIEGAFYCPSIPQPLIDATLDFREGRIDEATYRTRLEERWNYLARPKAKPDAEGHVRLACPAANPWPVVRCELKPASVRTENRGRLRIAVRPDVRANPPPSCTQQSVTIPPEAGAKYRQSLLFGSPEWQSTYATLRNTNEGFNGYVKDPAHEALDDAGRRRLNGVAAQSILTALLLLAANVRKIRTFLEGAAARRLSPDRHRPRRRRTRPLQTWRPRTVADSATPGPDPPLTA